MFLLTVETNGQDSMTKERALYVCRVYHGGIWVAGSQIEGQNRCTVTSLGNFYSYERYELLENVENSARLSWLPWDKFRKIPAGAVAADTMFVARHPVSAGDEEDDGKNDGVSPSYTHYIGTLDPKDKLGTITYVKAVSYTTNLLLYIIYIFFFMFIHSWSRDSSLNIMQYLCFIVHNFIYLLFFSHVINRMEKRVQKVKARFSLKQSLYTTI